MCLRPLILFDLSPLFCVTFRCVPEGLAIRMIASVAGRSDRMSEGTTERNLLRGPKPLLSRSGRSHAKTDLNRQYAVLPYRLCSEASETQPSS